MTIGLGIDITALYCSLQKLNRCFWSLLLTWTLGLHGLNNQIGVVAGGLSWSA